MFAGYGAGFVALAAAVGLAWLPSPPWKFEPGSGKFVGCDDDGVGTSGQHRDGTEHREQARR